jgi:hypothetical protein
MEYLIEKNVPIPPATLRGRPSQYPLNKMAVGDSIFFPDPIGPKAARAATGAGHRRKGRKFISRRLTENDQRGTRIWRTE